MLTETGLLLAGLAPAAPFAAVFVTAESASLPTLRFDPPQEGALAVFDAPAHESASGRFIVWLPACFVPDRPALRLKMVARTGHAQLLDIRPESYRTFAATSLPALYAQFAPLIDNMVALTQAPGHPLHAVMRLLGDALAADAAALAQPAATGAFDLIGEDRAQGWAWDPRLPELRQLVEIVDSDGVVVARGHAEHYRADLPAAGIGDGHHHFQITLPLSLRDGVARQLCARLPDHGVDLAGGPHNYSAAQSALVFFDLMPAPATWQRARRLSAGAGAALMAIHALIDNAQPRAAHDASLALLAEHGDSGAACVKLGEALLLMAHADAAALAYLRAQAADTQCPYAWLGLGNSHAQRGDWVAAQAAYETGLALDAGCAPLAARLAQVQPRAVTQRMRTLLQGGNTQDVVAGMIRHLFAHPDDEEACALLEKALHPGPMAPGACAQARRLQVYEVLIGEAARRDGLGAA